jgi:hypothetical protein
MAPFDKSRIRELHRFLAACRRQTPPHFIQVSHTRESVEMDLSHFDDHGFRAQTKVIQGLNRDGTNISFSHYGTDYCSPNTPESTLGKVEQVQGE